MTEQLPDLDHFDRDDAWRIGNALVARCHAESVAVTISIWPGVQVFHAALPGTSAGNGKRVDRKARLMCRFARSSLADWWVCQCRRSRRPPAVQRQILS